MRILERIRFMKINNHKRFEYMPRYFDERKERIENLKKIYSEDSEKDETDKAKRKALRDKMRSEWRTNNNYYSQMKRSNVRLIVILVLLLLAAYFIFGYVELFSGEVTNLND